MTSGAAKKCKAWSYVTWTHAALARVGAGVGKEPPLWVVVGDLLHGDAHDAPHTGAHAEGGNEETGGHLDAKGEDGDHQLEGERQEEQTKGGVHPRAGLGDLHVLIDGGEVAVVVAEGGLVGDAAAAEEQLDQVGGVHARVGIRVGDDGGDGRHAHHLPQGKAAQAAVLAQLTPAEVGADEDVADEAAHDAQHDEDDQLKEDPGPGVVDVEHHQVLVACGGKQ